MGNLCQCEVSSESESRAESRRELRYENFPVGGKLFAVAATWLAFHWKCFPGAGAPGYTMLPLRG